MSRETLGALVDAVYAIAATILALEIPAEMSGDAAITNFGALLVDYAITFMILFALWLQHRRINGLVGHYTPFGIWLNAVALMLVCLIPRATMLVFDHGGDVTLAEYEKVLFHGAQLTMAELVNLFFVLLVMGVDLTLLLLSRLAGKTRSDQEARDVLRSKATISVLTISLLVVSFLISVEQRFFLVIMPIALMFERSLYGLGVRMKSWLGKDAA